MAALLFRLMMVIVLLLMPHGLARAPAQAQASHPIASAGHCTDLEDHGQSPKSTEVDCAISCSVMPATGYATSAPVVPPRRPRSIGPVASFDGIVPEIATPPPKRA